MQYPRDLQSGQHSQARWYARGIQSACALLGILFLALLAQPTTAHANCTAPCTKAQILTDINTNWPDNTAQQITPALLRSTVLDLVNSYLDVNGTSAFACPTHQFLLAIATLSSYTCGQPAVADVSGFGTGVATALAINTNTAGGFPTSPVPVANGGTGDTGTAWTTFTPTPVCGTATITTNSARWKTLGKTVFIEIDLSISPLGTCTNSVTFTLPFTPAAGGGMSGRDVVATNFVVGCGNTGTGTTMGCALAGSANFINTSRIVATGVMESQ